MDPLSAAASVATALAILLQTINLAERYVHAIGKLESIASTMIEELQALSSNLRQLTVFLEKDASRSKNFGQTSMFVSYMKTCQRKLQDLNSKLDRVQSSRMKQLAWPLSEKEHRESIQELRALSQWIQFSLSIDTSALLSKSSEEILEILTNQKKAIQQLDVIEARTVSVEDTLQSQEILLKNARQEENQKQALSWLSNHDYETKHNYVRAPRVSGTGEWLFKAQEFQKWYTNTGAETLLWLHGDQGTGKSVLASLVVDRLKDKLLNTDSTLAYIYFDRHYQAFLTPATVFASLGRQLLLQKPQIPERVMGIYQTAKIRKPDFRIVQKIFLNVCSEFSKVYLILDALDECDDQFRKPIIEFLKMLDRRADTRILIASRFHPIDIQVAFGKSSQLKIEAQDIDLRLYISQRIENDHMSTMIDEAFKTQIIEKIVSHAHQLFLLPALQIQTLLDAPTVGEMEEALESLPITLSEAFDNTMFRIKSLPDSRRQLGMKALMWILHAKSDRHLMVNDLRSALAIRTGQKFTDPRLQPSTGMIVTCCEGLVAVDKATKQLRFFHQAVREYLETRKSELFPNSQASIAETCLTYLMTEPLIEQICDEEIVLQKKLTDSPFLWYAGCYWGFHAQNANSERVLEQTLEFLRSQGRTSCTVQILQYMRGRRKLYWTCEELKSYTKLHTAVLFGLERATRKLLEDEETLIDATTSVGTTALMEASSMGYTKIMELLLEKGADPEKMNCYGSSLHAAAEAGQIEAINILSKTKINISIEDRNCRTPLQCAIEQGHIPVAENLIARGASATKLKDDLGVSFIKTPNQGSDWWGECFGDSILFAFGNPHPKTRGVGNALHSALDRNNLELARVLLANGAAPDAYGRGGYRPLGWAAARGKLEAVRILLEAGAEVNGKSKGRTAYWYAASCDHSDIQKLLVDFGATVCPDPTQNEKDALRIEELTQRFKYD